MPTPTDPSGGPDCYVLSVIMPADIGDALDRAAGDALASRAGHARVLIAGALRDAGYLDPLPLPTRHPRRHRGARRQETAA